MGQIVPKSGRGVSKGGMNMKKILVAVLALICVSGLVGCYSEPKIFEIEGAEKLTVMSGATGTSIDITNADDIKYITDNINALKYSKGEKVNSDGWIYSLQWYDKNGNSIENLALLGDGYTIVYDGYYYKGMTVDYEIDLTFLENQFSKSLTGIVKEISENWLLIECEPTAENPWGEYNVSLNVENKDSVTYFDVGDEVVVYYDGNIAETTPLEIGKVYAITLKTPANKLIYGVTHDPNADNSEYAISGEGEPLELTE